MKGQILAAALLVSLVAPATAFARDSRDDGPKETERVDRTIPFAPGGTLRLKNFSGDIRITGTTEGQVVIAATRRASRARLDAVKLDIQSSGHEITIDANKRDGSWKMGNNNVVETTFEIRLPAETRLDVDAFSSAVRITDVRSPQKVHTFSGNIEVLGASDSLNLETFSGDIDLRMTDTTAAPDLRVETFSGSIRATMPEATAGNVRFDSFSGALKSDIPLTIESSSRRNVRGRLNNGGGAELAFKTFSGDVRISRD